MAHPPAASARKGARRISDIPAATLRAISRGDIETITLVEMLAADFRTLMKAVDPALEKKLRDKLDPAVPFIARMQAAGKALASELKGRDSELASHRSDIVRGWAAYMLAQRAGNNLKLAIKTIRPLADDPHSGVREWAWLAVRPLIVSEPEAAIKVLSPWSEHDSANLRRFASEATRPRGVWCAHIPLLKDSPHLAESLLAPLRADPSKYVQDSCGNWLNDASKTQPDWVRALCRRWEAELPDSAATARICRRALRTIASSTQQEAWQPDELVFARTTRSSRQTPCPGH
jgi:3-methyladenine DNA glycosylase AlkC